LGEFGERSFSFYKVLLFHFWKMFLSFLDTLGILLMTVLFSNSLELDGFGFGFIDE